MSKTLNVGMIGYGFMGRAHSNAYRKVSNFFDLPYQPGAQGRLCPRRGQGARRSPTSGATNRPRPTGGSWSSARTSTSSTSARRTTRTWRSPLAAAKAGKMILCEKPLAMNGAEGREDGRRPSRRPKVPNMVWYNYRRVPAVTFAKQLIDEGKLGRIFHYRAKFLQDWTISADLPQGGTGLWRLDVAAAGSGVTGDLLAHCIDTAIWLNGDIDTVNAMTETFVKERKHTLTGKVGEGRHRRRLRVPGPLQERLAGHVRIDALRPRPQGALHVRDQRRERLDLLGPARPASPAVLRPPRRRPAPRLAVDPRHRRRPPLHGQLVGAGPADRLRAQLRAPGRRLPRRRWPRASRPCPTSATPSGRSTSATPCSSRRRSRSG